MSFFPPPSLGLTRLPSGLEPGNHAAFWLLSNFAFTFCVVNSRIAKRVLGFDHNVAPREDVARYGEAMVKEGKLKRATLDRIKRLEAAHQNGVDQFGFFVGALLIALHAGLPASTVNRFGATYLLARVAHALSYLLIDNETWSPVRSVCWWAGNVACIWTIVKSGRAMGAGT